MGRLFCMKAQDLLELYQLILLYRTYPEDTPEHLPGFPEKIEERYRACGGKDIKRQTNPRRAGRKPIYTQEQNCRITELYQQGVTLRGIAKEIGCSAGHVQDVIRRGKTI